MASTSSSSMRASSDMLGSAGVRRLHQLTSNLVGGAAGIDRDNTDENSGNNYYDSTTEQNCLDPETQREVTAVDLWNTTGPARHLNGTYEERLEDWSNYWATCPDEFRPLWPLNKDVVNLPSCPF